MHAIGIADRIAAATQGEEWAQMRQVLSYGLALLAGASLVSLTETDAMAQAACAGVSGCACAVALAPAAPGIPAPAPGQLFNVDAGVFRASANGFTAVDPSAIPPGEGIPLVVGDQVQLQDTTALLSAGACQLSVGPHAIVSVTEPQPGCACFTNEALPQTTEDNGVARTLAVTGVAVGAGVGIYFLTKDDDESAPLSP